MGTLPPGLSRKYLNKLLSRPDPLFHVGGFAVVICPHGSQKRKVVDMVYDHRRERVYECLCCENLCTNAEAGSSEEFSLCASCNVKEKIRSG